MRKLASAIFILLLTSSITAAAERTNSEPKRAYGAVDVILYQTSWCHYCNKAREFLQGMGVSLIEYDIEKESGKRAEMMSKAGSPGVPVVDIEGIIIRGYSPDAMRSAIERKRRE